MNTVKSLRSKHCEPCEGDVTPLPPAEVQRYVRNLPGWELTRDGKMLSRIFKMKDFVAGIALVDRIALLAEAEGHHPDIHLTEYSNLKIDLWTHAVGGISMNDLILAVKIDDLATQMGTTTLIKVVVP